MGNRLSEDQDGKVTTYQYNTLCQLITSQTIDVDGTITSDKTYTYDKNGNQTNVIDSVKNEVCIYDYNERNLLVKITKEVDGKPAVIQSNTYDGSRQRTSKTEKGVTMHYYYDGDELLYKTDGDEQINCFNVIDESGRGVVSIGQIRELWTFLCLKLKLPAKPVVYS